MVLTGHNFVGSVTMARSLAPILLLASIAGPCRADFPRQKPLDRVEVLGLLLDDAPSSQIARQAAGNGLTFTLNQRYSTVLRQAGALDLLLKSFSSAKKLPEVSDGEMQGKEVLELLTSSIAYKRNRQWPQMEQECRAALTILPQRAILHVVLGYVLHAQGNAKEASNEYGAALRLDAEE